MSNLVVSLGGSQDLHGGAGRLQRGLSRRLRLHLRQHPVHHCVQCGAQPAVAAEEDLDHADRSVETMLVDLLQQKLQRLGLQLVQAVHGLPGQELSQAAAALGGQVRDELVSGQGDVVVARQGGLVQQRAEAVPAQGPTLLEEQLVQCRLQLLGGVGQQARRDVRVGATDDAVFLVDLQVGHYVWHVSFLQL